MVSRVFLLCQNYTQEVVTPYIGSQAPKHPLTEKILTECIPVENRWITQEKLDSAIDHLVKTVHRRIDKKKIGCCMIICSSHDVEHLCTKSQYKDYIIFDKSKKAIDHINNALIPLSAAAENYSIILPTSGVFLWNDDLQFQSVKSLGDSPLNKEDKDNSLIQITKNYSNSLAFFLERGENSILVYHGGELKYEYYISDYDGDWHTRSYNEMLDLVKKATSISPPTKGIKVNTYEDIFDAFWWMSYKKIGAMVVITKPEKIGVLKNKSEQGRKINQPYSTLKPNMIYDLAMVDGAILMGEDGEVKYGGVHFKFTSHLPDEIEDALRQKGLRHHQAGHIVCGDDDTFVFTVSENRGIGAFYKGEIIFLDR